MRLWTLPSRPPAAPATARSRGPGDDRAGDDADADAADAAAHCAGVHRLMDLDAAELGLVHNRGVDDAYVLVGLIDFLEPS